jgi:ATP-dependent DNA ligase
MRIMARRDSRGVWLLSRNGYNFADRFPKIVEAVASLPARSCFIDGEGHCGRCDRLVSVRAIAIPAGTHRA